MAMPSYHAHYTILNVLPDADPAVIEAAYKALMKKHHPDKHPAGPVAGERVAAELNRAWWVLRDPDRRAAYDAEERARQERHRVELARAFPEPAPRGASEPVRRPAPPHPARAGQRAATWIGMAGVVVLVGAIVVLARGPGELDAPVIASTTPLVVGSASGLPGLPAGLDEEAFRSLPVNRQQIFTAVAEFKRIADSGGLPAAARFSERCFAAQARSRGIGEFDYCVAFDHAASRTDLRPQAAPEPHFGPQLLVQRHVRAAADSLSRDTTIIESRLFEIRRLTDNALFDYGAPPPRVVTQVPQAERPTAAARPTPRRVVSRPQAAQRRAVRERAEEPRDFVERQGGIY